MELSELLNNCYSTQITKYGNNVVRWPFLKNDKPVFLEMYEEIATLQTKKYNFYLNNNNCLTKVEINDFLKEHTKLIRQATSNIQEIQNVLNQVINLLGMYTFSGGYQYGWKQSQTKIVIDALRNVYTIFTDNKPKNVTLNTLLKHCSKLKKQQQSKRPNTTTRVQSQQHASIQIQQNCTFVIPSKYNYLFIKHPKDVRIRHQSCKSKYNHI